MYIVRWLMGHPIVATWVLGAIALLLTFGSGQNNDTEIGGNTTVENTEVIIDGSKEGVADTAEQESTSQELSADKETVKSEVATESDVASNTNASSVTASIVSEKDSEAGMTAANVHMTSSTSFIPKKVDKDKDQNSESTEVTDLSQATTSELLQMAREAYWNNGLDEAAQIYNQLIKLEPKVIEHRGELGNVLWRQGFPKKAAELYSDIAIPMIEAGNSERVANMVGFIGLFYPDRATVIQDRLESFKGQ